MKNKKTLHMLLRRRKKLPRRYDNFYLAWVETAESFLYYLCVIFCDKQRTPTHYISIFNTSSFFIPIDIRDHITLQLKNNVAYYSTHAEGITPRKFNKRNLRVVRYLSIRHYVELLPLRRNLITLIKHICDNQKQYLQQ